jgi:hypothetical protein
MLSPLSLVKRLVLLSLYFISSCAFAQTFNSAASDGLGGAGRAAVEASDVNYLNPAALVHVKGRFIYSTWSRNDLSVGLSETSKDVLLPASLSFFQRKIENPGLSDTQVQEFRLSVADFVFEKFSMGLTGNMNSTKINDVTYNQTNANLGFFFTPTPNMGFAYVLYNVFDPTLNVPDAYRLKPQMALAFNMAYKNFLRARADILSGPNNLVGKPKYAGGFETILSEWFVTRVGYQNDILASEELVTFGIGFNGPLFAMNYSHQGSMKGKDFERHAIDLLFSF